MIVRPTPPELMTNTKTRPASPGDSIARLRTIVGIAGAIYLVWWFVVELALPGSFNPLAGRLVVVGLSWVLLAASYRIHWFETHLSKLFTAWTCLLVAHYCYLILGNHGDSAWWVGTFVTFAAVSMCMQSRGEVAVFSVFALACVLVIAAVQGQLTHSIYFPGLVTILLLANITKRSQVIAHDAMRQAAQADEQRLQLASIVESSDDAIIASDLNDAIQSFNKGAERLFGYAAHEVVGRSISQLLPEGQLGEEPALVARLRAGETVTPLETVRRRADGHLVDVSVTMSPIRESQGQIVGVSWAGRDISERKRAQLQIVRAREAAEAANRELEAFSFSVAHDLRGPLRSIHGFSHILLKDYGPVLDAVAQTHLSRVQSSAKLMGRLIDALLELGRISRTDLSLQRVNLSHLASATAERLREFEPDRAVEFLIDDGLSEQGDSTLLGAVLDNLLGNAWKFTRNTLQARIEVGRTDDNGRSVYYVRDNGVGFDMAHASKLFGVFQRLHSSEEFEGTGVGLATVQRIIRRHGGDVWADATVGEGAAFYFTFGQAADSSRETQTRGSG
jgi:PAS domain S-box-containing protein